MKKVHVGIILVFLILSSSMSLNAKEALNLNGEWDATFICSISGTYKEIIEITQDGDEFVGIRLSGDKRLIEEGHEIRGVAKGENVVEIEIDNKLSWVKGKDIKMSEGGNRIVIHSEDPYNMGRFDTTLIRRENK